MHSLLARFFGMKLPLFDILTKSRFQEVEGEIFLPAREGRSQGLPGNMHPRLAEKLTALGIERLWVHQRNSWDVAKAGDSFIVTTGTASGKSLCFNLPVLDSLLAQGQLRALYLYPTKALAQDQLRRLQELAKGDVEVAVYDGDTPTDARRLARERARILLTNPDMISMAILPHHERWSEFFFNLAFVVIDEAHTYRGVFGSHVANVLRRLRRVAGFYGTEPKFFLASATILNAVEHAHNLTGLDITPVSQDTAPSGRRKIVLWQPPLLDPAANLRRSNTTDAAQILAELLANGVRTICFTKSRRAAELVYQSTVRTLKERAPQVAGRLSPYRAGYTPHQRHTIERCLFSGELLGVVATNALELGIDVGALDAAMTVGYPGTVASLWQQWGRAGRGKGESLGLFLAGNDALEQFFIRHPDELLSRPVEAATIDFANPFIHHRHLLAAAYESPLVDEDSEYFGDGLPQAADRLVEEGRLTRRTGSWLIRGSSYPAADISLRSSSPDQFTIVEEESGSIVGSLEAESAFSFLHPGAVYLHMGDSYLVTKLDIDPRVAVVRPFHGNYYTQPRRQSTTEILTQDRGDRFGPLSLHLGLLSVTNQVIGYQKKQVGSDESLGVDELDLPAQHFLTEGMWFTIPLELISQDKLPLLPGGLHAIEHALIALLPLLAMCDRWDVGGLSTPVHPQTELPTIFVYDGHPGGVGISRQGFEQFGRWAADARSLIRDCPCEAGCPSCIQSPKCGNLNEPLNKSFALALLTAVLS